MRDSIRLVRVAGVDVRVHALFLLLPLFAVATGLPEGGAGIAIRMELLGILVGSVLAHELGHAFAARARGVRVGHVGLGPLGGVAWIGDPVGRDRVPRDRWIPALAGPAASLAVAGTLLGVLLALGRRLPPLDARAIATDPLLAALAVNALMGVVNLAPAFPADGGRALHAALGAGLGDLRAARAVVLVGDGVAMALAAAGLAFPDAMRTPACLLAALLVVAAGRRETRLAAARAAGPGPVGDGPGPAS